MSSRFGPSVAACAGLLVAAACGNGSSQSAGAVTCSGALEGGLAAPPSSQAQDNLCGGDLDGTRAAGATCQTNEQCSATCCACATGSNTALVAWCDQGTCSSPNDACCAFQQTQSGFCGP